jgi:hypothetical protein
LGEVVDVLELVVEDDSFVRVATVALVLVVLGRTVATLVAEVPPVLVMGEMEEMVPPSVPEAQPATARTTASAKHSVRAPTKLRIAPSTHSAKFTRTGPNPARDSSRDRASETR